MRMIKNQSSNLLFQIDRIVHKLQLNQRRIINFQMLENLKILCTTIVVTKQIKKLITYLLRNHLKVKQSTPS